MIATPAPAGRLKFIDGLRAVAVLMVMLFHFYYQQISEVGTKNVNPKFLQEALQFGNMGVYIFFVISGFIVSYVTYNKIVSLKYILSFIVRRQVRLDPPFWLALIVGTALAIVSVDLLGNSVYRPTGMDFLLNATYLFDIFDRYDIIRVGWTLCLEIQFYLAFVLLSFFINRFISSRKIGIGIYLFFFLLSITCSLLWRNELSDYITNYWFIFFLGVACTLRIKNEISVTLFVIILLLPYVLLMTDFDMVLVYFSTITALMISLSFYFKKYNVWLSSGVFQFFGLISYSLYLTHCLIGNRIVRYLKSAWEWEPENLFLNLVILLLSMVISTIFAYSFYLIIEKRSIKWSKTISALIE